MVGFKNSEERSMAASTTVNHANGAAKETAPEEPPKSEAAAPDLSAVERIEQREWQESLDYVLHDGGPARAQRLSTGFIAIS